MKLIIDIPDEAYNRLLTEQYLPNRLDIEYFIIHGIPLDKVRAEIAELQKEYKEYGWAYDDVLEVIDKYREGESK